MYYSSLPQLIWLSLNYFHPHYVSELLNLYSLFTHINFISFDAKNSLSFKSDCLIIYFSIGNLIWNSTFFLNQFLFIALGRRQRTLQERKETSAVSWLIAYYTYLILACHAAAQSLSLSPSHTPSLILSLILSLFLALSLSLSHPLSHSLTVIVVVVADATKIVFWCGNADQIASLRSDR